ncbi:hypothetical protein Tco_1190194, partial [Tanacetum coccineum]
YPGNHPISIAVVLFHAAASGRNSTDPHVEASEGDVEAHLSSHGTAFAVPPTGLSFKVVGYFLLDPVWIKRLLDDLRVTAVKLVLLVQKLLLLVLKVNAAGIKVTTAERLQLLNG